MRRSGWRAGYGLSLELPLLSEGRLLAMRAGHHPCCRGLAGLACSSLPAPGGAPVADECVHNVCVLPKRLLPLRLCLAATFAVPCRRSAPPEHSPLSLRISMPPKFRTKRKAKGKTAESGAGAAMSAAAAAAKAAEGHKQLGNDAFKAGDFMSAVSPAKRKHSASRCAFRRGGGAPRGPAPSVAVKTAVSMPPRFKRRTLRLAALALSPLPLAPLGCFVVSAVCADRQLHRCHRGRRPQPRAVQQPQRGPLQVRPHLACRTAPPRLLASALRACEPPASCPSTSPFLLVLPRAAGAHSSPARSRAALGCGSALPALAPEIGAEEWQPPPPLAPWPARAPAAGCLLPSWAFRFSGPRRTAAVSRHRDRQPTLLHASACFVRLARPPFPAATATSRPPRPTPRPASRSSPTSPRATCALATPSWPPAARPRP